MPTFSRFMRYFLVVGQQGSIRKAAEALNVSASAIDRQILNAEAELGVQLFERLPTGLRLTAAGELLMASGGRWLQEMTSLRAQVEDLRGLKRGHVEFAIINALAKGYIPGVISAIHRRYPGITIGVHVMSNEDIHAAIVDGQVDFGIMFEPQSHRDLTVRAFVEVVLGFLTPPGHALAELDKARFSACADEKIVAPADSLAVGQQVNLLEKLTSIELSRVTVANNIQMIISLAMQGVGVGILTSLDVITEVKRGLLSFTPISDPMVRPMTLALCTASARRPSYAAQMVLSEVENGFAELGFSTAD